MFIIVYRPHNELNLDTRYIGPFTDYSAAYDYLDQLPAIGPHLAPRPSQPCHNPGVKFIQELEAPNTKRVTNRAVPNNDYCVQWGDDAPELWQGLEHEPTYADLDRLCKERGLWAPGKDYPDFTIWHNGADIAAGGGPNSGVMADG